MDSVTSLVDLVKFGGPFICRNRPKLLYLSRVL